MAYDPTKDQYRDRTAFTGPARKLAEVTPSDAAQLPTYAKALRVYVPATVEDGVATVVVTPIAAADDNDTVTLTFVPGVTIEPVGVRKVWASGTTEGVEIHAYTV